MYVYNSIYKYVPTGCPAQAKAMPPHVADTITTTKSEISLQSKKQKNSNKQSNK